MHRIIRAAALGSTVALSIASVQACAHHEPPEAASQVKTYITVRNPYAMSYTLYLRWKNISTQVGIVGPVGKAHIRVPGNMAYPGSQVDLVAVPTMLPNPTLYERFVADPGADIPIELSMTH